MYREEFQTEMLRDVTDTILKFNETITSITNRTVPETLTNLKYPCKSWFNDDCIDTVTKRLNENLENIQRWIILVITASSEQKL